MAIKTGVSPSNWVPKYSLAMAGSGFVVEDERYFVIKLEPQAWEANAGGTGYRIENLFNFTIGQAMIPFITGVEYLRAAPTIDTQPNFPPQRGGGLTTIRIFTLIQDKAKHNKFGQCH